MFPLGQEAHLCITRTAPHNQSIRAILPSNLQFLHVSATDT